MTDLTVLEVLLHGHPIGTLTRTAGDRTLFAFNSAYLSDEKRSTLSLSFKDSFGQLITDFRPTQTRLLPYFSNLLPEGPMRRYLANRANVNAEREFFLLSALGHDLPGAVSIHPVDDELEHIAPAHDNDEFDDDTVDQATQQEVFRFSLAGVQLKFSGIEAATGGLTIPAHGVGGSWIIKLPSRTYPRVPENEFAMMTLASKVGIDVPLLKLVELDRIQNLPNDVMTMEGAALAIERFDRLPNRTQVHIEDFAQIFSVYPERKYERASARNIAGVIGTEGSDADIAEFIRRLTYNTLIGNADMHLKNWSLIYPNRRNAALAPAYDFISTVAFLPDDKAALTVSRTKRFDEFSQDELSHLAAKARLPSKLVLDAAKETVALFHQHWRAEKKNLPITRDTTRAVEAHVKTVPIAWQ